MSEKSNSQKFLFQPFSVTMEIVPAKNDTYSHTRYCYTIQNLLAESLYVLTHEGNLVESVTLEPFGFFSYCSNKTAKIIPVRTIKEQQ